MCEKWIQKTKVMEQKNTVVEDNAMDVFMDGPFMQWVRQKCFWSLVIRIKTWTFFSSVDFQKLRNACPGKT